jgi:succinoglycan biosynthesis protein ExoO
MVENQDEGCGAGTPLVSILIVARNTGAFIDAAIRSARHQTIRDIEIVVIDDGSTDDTRVRAARHVAEDRRVRLLDGPQAGLVAVRNASLDAAHGQWAAILDSDDLLHPRHIERLLEAARRTGAQLVAANMVVFHSAATPPPSLFAAGPSWRQEQPIALPDYIRANMLFAKSVSLGYLKPLFNMTFMREQALQYDPRLRIGEDYDLVVRAIAAGARFVYIPQPSYFYRRHEASTSHRLARKDLVGLLESADAGLDGGGEPVRSALAARRASLVAALAHHDAIEALKARQPLAMFRHLASHPGAVRLMAQSVREAVAKRVTRSKRPRQPEESRPAGVVLLLGSPVAGSAIERLRDSLAAAGRTIVERPLPAEFEESELASGLPEVDLILLSQPAAADAAPFVLKPDAPWIAAVGFDHPAIALHVALGEAEGALDLTALDEDQLLAAIRAISARQPTVSASQ